MKHTKHDSVVIVGGGPAGLAAAEVLAAHGHAVDIYDAMPSVGRKFLLAGIGGLNLTHSEPADTFVSRYGAASAQVARWLADFDAAAVRDWAHGLGIETFVGSSGRVFPRQMKAAPLLRAWLHRLREHGVRIHVRQRWLDWAEPTQPGMQTLRLAGPDGEHVVEARALILALGGASWPRLGSDGSWQPLLRARGARIAPLRPANCGFEIARAEGEGWSPWFREHHAGQPLKNIAACVTDASGRTHSRRGECLITAEGIEGSLIYALSAPLRDSIDAHGEVTLYLDLAPQRDPASLRERLAIPRGTRSLASHIRSKAGLHGLPVALLRECAPDVLDDPARLAATLKAVPLRLVRPRPLAEAISTAGGLGLDSLDERLMLRSAPGLFCCGEMLDWEAPTGGYLLTACLASGRAAGAGVHSWLEQR